MVKHLVLGAAGLIASVVSAQQATSPAQTTSVPVAPAPNPVASTPVPVASAPVPLAQMPRPATTSGEIATIVAREFAAYDKNADGGLSAAEFGDWMVKLKTIADPSVTADAPSTKTWLGAAFAQADLDRSRSVTLAELTGFLSPAVQVAVSMVPR